MVSLLGGAALVWEVYLYTVESPNNGHVRDMASVRCRELSAFRRLVHLFIKTPNMHHLNAVLHILKLKLREKSQFILLALSLLRSDDKLIMPIM